MRTLCRLLLAGLWLTGVTLRLQAAPVALWVSEPVRPGQTVLVFGEGFANCHVIALTRLVDDATMRPLTPTATVRLTPGQVRPKSVKFTIPATVAPGLYRAVLMTPTGNLTLTLNRPQILWIQGDQGLVATPGGLTQVFGKNIRVAGHMPRLRVRALTGRGSSWDLAVGPGLNSPFACSGRVPVTLPPGTYQLQAHNGCGGAAGWSDPVMLRIVTPPAAPTYQVSVDKFGARGDDAEDDTAATQQAIRAVAEHGGGIVNFGRGRYLLSDQIAIAPQVTLRGAGVALTALCWGDTDTPPAALLRGTGHFTVEDLTLYAQNYQHGIVGDQTGDAAGHVRVRRVRLRLNPYRGHLTTEEVDKRFVAAQKLSSGGGDSLRLGGPDVEVTDCDIYGAGRALYLSRGAGVWIHDNTFYNGRWGWYCISGSNGVLFERNQIIGGDLMSTGGGLNCLDGSMVSQNVYYADNNLKNMFGWDREAMTTDAGGGPYFGKVAGAQGTQLTLADDAKWDNRDWAGAGVFILDGRGQGQYRQLVKAGGHEVMLDAPWAIAPDTASIITITMLQRNYLFINNHFADAGVAIQMYGTSIGNIAYGNVSERTGGFHNFGMNYDGIQPSWFTQWLNNRITEGNVYGGGHDQSVALGQAHLGVFALPPGGKLNAPLTLCSVVRDNHLENNAELAVGGSDPPNPSLTYPFVQEVVVENNLVEQSQTGLRIARASAGIYARNNTFRHCVNGMVDDLETERQANALRQQLYAEPGPLLHLTFDKLEGKTFRDSTGHGFDAQCVGHCVADPQGAQGGCVTLDGTAYLTVCHPELLKMESYTLAAWVKTDHLSGRYGIISKRLRGTETPFILGVTDATVGFEATDTNDAWSFNFASPPALTAGQWHHIAAVMQAGQGVTLYADGKPIAHKANAGTVIQNDEPLCIGHEAWGGDPPKGEIPAFFHGSIDDVQIWPHALSAEAVAKLAVR